MVTLLRHYGLGVEEDLSDSGYASDEQSDEPVFWAGIGPPDAGAHSEPITGPRTETLEELNAVLDMVRSQSANLAGGGAGALANPQFASLVCSRARLSVATLQFRYCQATANRLSEIERTR